MIRKCSTLGYNTVVTDLSLVSFFMHSSFLVLEIIAVTSNFSSLHLILHSVQWKVQRAWTRGINIGYHECWKLYSIVYSCESLAYHISFLF